MDLELRGSRCGMEIWKIRNRRMFLLDWIADFEIICLT